MSRDGCWEAAEKALMSDGGMERKIGLVEQLGYSRYKQTLRHEKYS